MTYILISILMLVGGIIGILKSKRPKNDGTIGFAAEHKLYYSYYLLVILGITFLIMEICE